MDNFAYLSQNPMVFEPISSLNSVFFDPANNQVSFHFESPWCTWCKCEDFGNYTVYEFSNSSQLLGFVWTRDHELVCVTADGFELYQVNPTKRLASLLKQGAVQTNWYTWDPLNAILLLSSGSLATKFHVISFPCLILIEGKYPLPLPGTRRGIQNDSMYPSTHPNLKIKLCFHYALCNLSFPVTFLQAFVSFAPTIAYLNYPPKDDSTWIVFPPNVVIDGSLGCLWTVELNLETFAKLISDPVTLVDCLTNRVGGKSVLLNYCRILVHQAVQELSTSVEENTSNNTLTFNREGFVRHLETFSRIFSRLAAVQSSAAKAKASVATGERISENCPEPIGQLYLRPFLFTLDDVNDSIFSVLSASEEPAIQRLLSHLVLDYMRVLKAHSLPVDAMLDELLVSSIVKAGDFCRLVHCVQSHTLKNSTHIALPIKRNRISVLGASAVLVFQLLALESAFPPAGHLALDMLQSRPDLFTLPDTPRKLLDAAKQSSNPLVFYSIFRFFELAAQRQAPYACSLHDSKYQPYRNHFVLSGSDTCVHVVVAAQASLERASLRSRQHDDSTLLSDEVYCMPYSKVDQGL
ncbi:unnamed protein product [Schistocephalus solidus]|uniref:Mic1 domain-containing protein n=1 Tax=Schistocephalus solidus TaxID=70667 RepID=A0A183SJP7_SCHSO|nr:unnamed protein product [Schistocephalus solidus]